jgi:hypothetical protein
MKWEMININIKGGEILHKITSQNSWCKWVRQAKDMKGKVRGA